MTPKNPLPIKIIHTAAPNRVCDNGGWTDTWFAEYGSIFNIAVAPKAQVQLAVYPRQAQERQIVIDAENFGDRYGRELGDPWGKHPLIEAAIEEMGVPEELSLAISLFSEMPAGASVGSSAAITMALIGALDALTPGRLSAHQAAGRAQRVETVRLGGQCGIQDQLAAAYGGINYIDMFNYPHASVSPILLPQKTFFELERRLILIYLGQSHSSTKVHEHVIRGLEDAGAEAGKLAPLRKTAAQSRDALVAGDFAAFGKAMIANTEGQRGLHPELVSSAAEKIIEIGQSYGALGWKVNGAGGDGGSVTILAGHDDGAKRAMVKAIEKDMEKCRQIPIHISRVGLQTWGWKPETSHISLS